TLAAIAAVSVWYLLAPKHTGFAKLHVAFNKPSFDNRPQNQNDFKTYLQTTAGKIMSRPVITAALKRDEVRRLGLENRVPDPILYIEEDLKVEFKENSELLTIMFASDDAQVATTVANAIKEAYMDEFNYVERNLRLRNVTELEKAHSESVESVKTKK